MERDSVLDEELAALTDAAGHTVDTTSLTGLAISGGGIRSATFALGVLQALKEYGLLPALHYLSTVSGGGYVGGWLSANCRRAADNAEIDWRSPGADWNTSIAHLRRYSNYLSPEVGFFSADSWSMLTVWFRNALLVQATVVFAVACLLLLPRFLIFLFGVWPHVGDLRWLSVVLFLLGVVGIAGNQLRVGTGHSFWFLSARGWLGGLLAAALCGAVAWFYGRAVGFSPFECGQVDLSAALPIALLLALGAFALLPVGVRLYAWRFPESTEINYTQPLVQVWVVAPMLLTAFFVGAILWGEIVGCNPIATADSYGAIFVTAASHWPFPLAVMFVSLWLLSFTGVDNLRDGRSLVTALLAPFPCMLVLHALLSAIVLFLRAWRSTGAPHGFVWAPALVLFAFSLTIIVLIGMVGRQSREGVREWWSRLGAWLAIYGVTWMIIAVAAVYGPWLVRLAFDTAWWTSMFSAAGGVGAVVTGLFAGHSSSTGGEETKGVASRIMQVAAHAAPYVFIAGLLVGVGTLLDTVIALNADGHTWWTITDVSGVLLRDGSEASRGAATQFLFVSFMVFAACLPTLLLLGRRVDINLFSLNAFYRSRLVRCYLGATRRDRRKPQNFTGFDDDDDLPLASLVGPGKPLAGPLHILNGALNLGGSGDLALHTRHSASFTWTPIASGSYYAPGREDGAAERVGFAATATYGGRDGAPTLGQAMSVSGAAASPNMGYHTSPVIAFLLTVFNLRLGWWFPHPGRRTVTSPGPRFNLSYMFAELFGGASHDSDFLMVSDGGHFENLAVYELVRRECAVIIASDAECDPSLSFEGLGTLIRMCEVDFGARIQIDVRSLRPREGATWSSSRCAVGRITYRSGRVGTLIYIKAAMTGHEDTSILQYKASHPLFPHESTGDQFYADDQFESYRRLGYEAAGRALATATSPSAGASLHEVAERMFYACSASLDRVGQFTDHSQRLTALWEKLRSNTGLEALDVVMTGRRWPDDAPPDFRSIFYVAFEMIQLMENVYLDLGLEETWDHPDHEGWKTLFRNWAQSDAIRTTWQMTGAMFGRRFRYFCQRRLGLPPADEPAPV